jgi:NTP pyrophosphatase (non-canonical NTP hydrolase)
MALSFKQLRKANVKRCESAFHPVKDWSPTDWGCAAAGEMGETCNLLKKMLRGQKIKKQDVADEIADVIMYMDLLAARLDIDLGEAVRHKFNVVSNRKKSDIKL